MWARFYVIFNYLFICFFLTKNPELFLKWIIFLNTFNYHRQVGFINFIKISECLKSLGNFTHFDPDSQLNKLQKLHLRAVNMEN